VLVVAAARVVNHEVEADQNGPHRSMPGSVCDEIIPTIERHRRVARIPLRFSNRHDL
jgi:hypothetical protein